MPAVRSSDLTIVVVACSAMAVLTAIGAAGTATGGGGVAGSSFSAGPDGAKAAFLTLKDLGYAIDRSYEPLTSITADPSRSAIVLASPLEAPSEQDRRALERFANAGGRVLVTGSGGAAFIGAVMAGDDHGSDEDAKTYSALSPGPLTPDAPAITMVAEVARATFADHYTPAYGAGPDVVVRTATLGAGRVVWWAGSTPLTNAAIAEAGNLALLLNSIGEPGRAVLWDERYHGHSRSLWSYVAATPLPWAGAQIALMAIAAVLVFSRRLGPVRPAFEDPRTSSMEFVDTMGGLYEQAGAASAAVAAARHRLRRALLGACGLTPDATDERLAAAAAARVGIDREELAGLLAAGEHEAGDTTGALTLVQRLQAATVRVSAPIRR